MTEVAAAAAARHAWQTVLQFWSLSCSGNLLSTAASKSVGSWQVQQSGACKVSKDCGGFLRGVVVGKVEYGEDARAEAIWPKSCTIAISGVDRFPKMQENRAVKVPDNMVLAPAPWTTSL